MNEDEQKKIFSRNLLFYISLNGKQQIEVAKDLDINPTTLNMWCNGKSMPSVGKIQMLADYFRIGKSDLTDKKEEKTIDEEYTDIIAKITMNDERFKKIIIAYYNMSANKKDLLCDFFENFIL